MRPWLVAMLLLTACAARPYRVSDHFDGRHFRNPAGAPAKGLWSVLRWKLTSYTPAWQGQPNAPYGPPPPARVAHGALRVTFVNHATTLLQFDGLNVLTDPIWSERASPFGWIGPRRVRPPGLAFEALPPIDLVLVSHDHYDHLDLPTLQRLEARHHPRFVVPLGNARTLRDAGLRDVVELDWWQSFVLPSGLRGHLTPAQHFSARGAFDRDQTLWGGYVLESAGGPLFFAGDTAFGPHFAEVQARFGAMRLAVLPIGAFLPRWFMQPIHVDPDEALAAHRALQAQTSVAMHFGTFQLADEAEGEAQDRLKAALARARLHDTFWLLDFGEGRDVRPLPRPSRLSLMRDAPPIP